MAVFLVINPSPKIYTRTMLHGVGRAENSAEMQDNLRLIAAVILAHWFDSKPEMNLAENQIFDMVTSERFYESGYNKAIHSEHDHRLWFCTYVGFEKITSKWAKENCPDCNGYICMRIHNLDENNRERDNHTIQIYF